MLVILWCLFGYSSNLLDFAQHEILNNESFNEAQQGAEICVEVEIGSIDEIGNEFRIVRRETFQKHQRGSDSLGSLLQIETKRRSESTWVEIVDPEMWVNTNFSMLQTSFCVFSTDVAQYDFLQPDSVRTVAGMLERNGLNKFQCLEALTRMSIGITSTFSYISENLGQAHAQITEEFGVELYGFGQRLFNKLLGGNDRVSLDLATSIEMLRELRSSAPLIVDGILDGFAEEKLRRCREILDSVAEGDDGIPPRQVLVFSSECPADQPEGTLKAR